MYVTSDVIRVWTERKRLPGSSVITVNIDAVLLDTFASSKTIAFFSCKERIFGLKIVLKLQTILPFPPDIILAEGSDGSTGRGRAGEYRDIIVPDRVNTEPKTMAAPYGVMLASW